MLGQVGQRSTEYRAKLAYRAFQQALVVRRHPKTGELLAYEPPREQLANNAPGTQTVHKRQF